MFVAPKVLIIKEENGIRGTPKRHQMIGLIPHFQLVKCHTQSSSSELEVDERL